MNHTTLSRRAWLATASAAALAAVGPRAFAHNGHDHPLPLANAPLPGKSIYQLPIGLTDQTGKTFQLAELRGTPMVIGMFYTSCQFACPMLIEAIRANEDKLTTAERARLKVTLVSFDPEHDTVEALRKTAQAHGVDMQRWAMARTDGASVRKLAAMLGIQYRAIGGGDFNHTTAQILLDADGQIIDKTTEIAKSDPEFVKALKRASAAR